MVNVLSLMQMLRSTPDEHREMYSWCRENLGDSLEVWMVHSTGWQGWKYSLDSLTNVKLEEYYWSFLREEDRVFFRMVWCGV